jgi:uridine phosphorylase
MSGKIPSVNDRLASLHTNGANTSQQSFNSEVGMKSSGDDFSGQFLMSLSVSLTVTWRNWLSSGGGELGTDMEILGLMTASRSRIVWRMVVSLLTKKSEKLLLSF